MTPQTKRIVTEISKPVETALADVQAHLNDEGYASRKADAVRWSILQTARMIAYTGPDHAAA